MNLLIEADFLQETFSFFAAGACLSKERGIDYIGTSGNCSLPLHLVRSVCLTIVVL